MKQHYDLYEKDDFEVWRTLCNRQMSQLTISASATYLAGLEKINFSADEIPRFNIINQKLKTLTKWELIVVPGLIPDLTFFELMSNKKFPATTWLRKKSELDYLEEPDMFHDIFAHVPLLTDTFFVKFLAALSSLGLAYGDNLDAIEALSRIYWFTVEFGLIREKDQLKIYGAGILSSSEETTYCLSEKATRFDFELDKIMHLDFRKDVIQECYFIISSYEQLYKSIPEINKKMYLLYGKGK